jgi:hypothetical protein
LPPDISASRAYIEGALAYTQGSHTFEDVADAVAAGQMQAWVGATSVIITEIIEYPRYRVLNFFLAGGNRPELEQMYPEVEAFGRRMGCDRAGMLARKGWERTFLTQKEGWAPTLVAFEKILHG